MMRIIRIKAAGTLVLRGRDGRVINDHKRNTSPFYLPNFSDEYDPARDVPEPDHRCEVCYRIDKLFSMLWCDGCNLGYHMECLTPPLAEVPLGEWYCPIHLYVPAGPVL